MRADWRRLSLEEAGVVLIDCDHRTPASAEEGYPYVAIPQLREGRIDFSGARRITKEDFTSWTRKARPQGYDVVLSRRCNPGETAVVPVGAEFAVGQNLVLLRADGTGVYPPFLRWLARGPDWWEQVGKFINVGAVFDSLKCAHVPKFVLAIPPLPEQRAIAEFLWQLDDKIELNRQMSETIEKLARALFASWFGVLDPDRMPDGWTAASLGDHVEVTRGLSYSSAGLVEDGIPLHNLDSIADTGGYRFDGLKHFRGDYQPRHLVNAGDLLVVNTDLTWAFQRIAQPAVVPKRFGDLSLFSADLFRVRPRSGSWLTARFLYLGLTSTRLRQLVVGYSNGTTVNHLAPDGLKRPRLSVPPAELVQRFDQAVQPLFAKQEQLQLESEVLARLRDILLLKLMSGEIRLKEVQQAAAEAN